MAIRNILKNKPLRKRLSKNKTTRDKKYNDVSTIVYYPQRDDGVVITNGTPNAVKELYSVEWEPVPRKKKLPVTTIFSDRNTMTIMFDPYVQAKYDSTLKRLLIVW